jgi:hypothetical protein
MSTRRSRRAQSGIDREKFDFPGDFGSVREGFGTCSGRLKAVTGDLGGRRASSARRNARAARPRHHAKYDPLREKDEFYAGKVKNSTLTPYDGVNHDFMFGVGVVDKARAAMSQACEWLSGTPTSATMTLSTTQRERKRCGNRLSCVN